MFELQSDDNSIVDYWEKIFESNWAFIVGHTRKLDKIRVLTPRNDFHDMVKKALRETDKATRKKISDVSFKVIPESEWLLPEEKN